MNYPPNYAGSYAIRYKTFPTFLGLNLPNVLIPKRFLLCNFIYTP